MQSITQGEPSPPGTQGEIGAFFRSSPAAVSIVDPDTALFIEVNEAFERVFGWTRAETVGRHGDDLPIWNTEIREEFFAAIRQAGGNLRNFETRRLRKGGEEFTALLSTEIISFAGRRYRLNSIIDISAEARVRSALRESRDEFARLNATLEQRVHERTQALESTVREFASFSYAVSHDLRAPIRAIASFAEILRHDYGPALPGPAHEHLHRVVNAALRIGTLVDALLALSAHSRANAVRAMVDISSVSSGILAGLAAQVPLRRVRVDVEPGLVAQGDPTLLENLLENLLGNAWKFTAPTADACIRVGREGEWLYVADNGVGFDPRYTHKLFKPFERLHGDNEFPGTGIGLALASQIVHRHGGTISGEGETGGGATFRFTLPGDHREG